MVHTSNYHSGSHRNHSHNHGGHGGAGLYHSHSHRSHNHRHRHHHRDLSEDQPIFPSLCKYTIFTKIGLTYGIANVVCNITYTLKRIGGHYLVLKRLKYFSNQGKKINIT